MDLLWNNPVEWYQYLLFCGTMIGCLHLGYGESKPYWYKALVGCSYAIPFFVIGINPFAIAIPFVFILLFWLSNKSGFFANTFVWKCVELIVGFSFGISTAWYVRSNEWLMIASAVSGAALFAIGGTGYKWARRFVMPVLLTLLLWLGLN